MTSDEIEIAFEKYKDGIEDVGDMDGIEIATMKYDFTAGYTQGRADALKELEKPEGFGVEKAAIEFDKTYLKNSDSEKVREARRFGFSIGARWAQSKNLPGGEND